MIIDATAQVAPKRYADKELRQMMGDFIGKSSDDDLLAYFLWAQEGRIALMGCERMRDVHAAIKDHLDALRYPKSSDLKDVPFAQEEYRDSLRGAVDRLIDSLNDVKHAWGRASDLFKEMRDQFGEGSPVGQWEKGGGRPSPLEEIGSLWDEVLATGRAASEILKGLEIELSGVRALNDKRARFSEGEKKFTLEQIDNFDHKNFEILVSWLSRRDGMKAKRTGGSGDLGADVIAETPDGRRIVFQCKHNKGNRSVDSAAVQRLNGTARPVHKADVVAMVASGQFSEPAKKFAQSQNIHLINRERLRIWSEWGDSLYFLLGLPEPPARDEGETSHTPS